MKEMRKIGNMVEKLMHEHNETLEDIGKVLNCSSQEVLAFEKGLCFLTFNQLEELAKHFNISIDTLLNGDEDYYNHAVAHCFGDFKDTNNREEILDIIDDYIFLLESTYDKRL